MKKSNIIAFIGLMICPLLGFFISLINLMKGNRNLINYIIYSFFISILFINNPPFADSLAYKNMYDSVNETDVNTFSNYIVYYIISYYFKNFGIPYAFIPFLHVFLMILFLSLSLSLIAKRYNWDSKIFVLALFGITIISNPLVASMGQRNSLAISAVILGVILQLIGRKFTSILYMLLGSIIHFTMLPIIIIFFLSRIIRLNKYIALFIFILGINFSIFFNDKLFSILFNTALDDHYSAYKDISIELGSKGEVLYTYLQNFFKFGFLYLFLSTRVIKNDALVNRLEAYISLSICFLGFIYQNIVGFNRYYGYVILFIFIYILISYFKNRIKKIDLILLLLLLSINLIIFDYYSWREPVLNGHITASMLQTPIYTFLNIFNRNAS